MPRMASVGLFQHKSTLNIEVTETDIVLNSVS